MPGIVKRRADQIVHRRVHDDETPGAALLDVEHLRDEQPGRRRQHPTRLERQGETERAEDVAHQVRIARRLQRALGVVADADPAAEIDTRDGKPESAQFEDELGDPLEGAAIRLEIDQLRADMHRKADRLDAGKLAGELVCGNRLVKFDAEFVLLPAGRDLGVGMRVDIRVDPDRDRARSGPARWRLRSAGAAPASTRH